MMFKQRNEGMSAADVFYLFRDTKERRDSLQRVMDGMASGLDGSQLFGFEDLLNQQISVDCNLSMPRPGGVYEFIHNFCDRIYSRRTGIGLGDMPLVMACRASMNRSRAVVATSDNTALPAARLKYRRLLNSPLSYISIGLPERIRAVASISPARAERYRRMLCVVDSFIAYGYAESEWLRKWVGPAVPVNFIPFGVDTAKWRPVDVEESVDVLSIGADSMRDFMLILEYARTRRSIRVELIVGDENAVPRNMLPPNVSVEVRMPISELPNRIGRARVIVLPVKENTYSGATTTLLQCMSMQKAVAVSRVGAIEKGYGLEDDLNMKWLLPGSLSHLTSVVDGLLANTQVRQGLAERAREHVKTQLEWSLYVRRLYSCVKESMRME